MDYLDLLQQTNNIIYRLFGLTDYTLELQVYINMKRNETDTCDYTEIISSDDKGEYVQ